MTVDVIDKITIPSGQAFNNKDELYQKFSGSLIKTLKQKNSQSTSAEVFPNGTTGTAAFYVYVMDGIVILSITSTVMEESVAVTFLIAPVTASDSVSSCSYPCDI